MAADFPLTPADIKAKYESNADTNAFDDTEQTKLGGVEDGATTDQTGAEVKTAYEMEANAYTDEKNTMLANIDRDSESIKHTLALVDQANGVLPTLGGAWDQPGSPLANLTDDDPETSLTTACVDNDVAWVYIEIDLGADYEIDSIVVLNRPGEGVVKVQGNNQNLHLKTLTAALVETTQKTQIVLPDSTWRDFDLSCHVGMVGRYVRIATYGQGTPNTVQINPSLIQVFVNSGERIKLLYEKASNAYTDTKDTKLTGIEDGADVTEIYDAAHGITPTTYGAWDGVPAPLANLTDGDITTHLTTPAQDNDMAECGIHIDLGSVKNIVSIEVQNRYGEGVQLAAGANPQSIILATRETTGDSWTDIRTHVMPSDGAYHDIDINSLYAHKARYIYLRSYGQGTPKTYFWDLSLIRVNAVK